MSNLCSRVALNVLVSYFLDQMAIIWIGILIGTQDSQHFAIYRVFFLTGPTQKVLNIRLHSKSHQKSSKCQNLITDWHLEVFGLDQLKKAPCMCNIVLRQKLLFRKSTFLLLSSRIFKPVTASNQLLLDVAESAVDAS